MVEDGSPNKRVKRKKKKVVEDTENSKQVAQMVSKVNSNRLASRPEVAKRIRVYRNGDAYHKGINFVLNMRQENTIHTILDVISEKIGLIKGAKRLYTVDGDLIRSTHDLLNNNECVASSGPFLPLPYGQLGTGTRRASFSATNRPRKEGTSFTMNSTPKQTTSMPAPSRPSRSLEPRNRAARQTNHNGNTTTNGYLKGIASPAGRKTKRTSALSGESSMNNLGFAGLEIQARTKPKEKKIKKVTSSSKEPSKEKKKKKVKSEDVEVVTPITSGGTEVESSPPASVPPTIQSMSRSDSVRRESDIFPLESRQEEEEQDEVTKNEEAQDDEELLHGYHDPEHHAADSGEEGGEQQRDGQQHRSATPEEEQRSLTPADNQVEDEDWSPAPGEEEKPLTDLEDVPKHEEIDEREENLSIRASPEDSHEEKSDDDHQAEHQESHRVLHSSNDGQHQCVEDDQLEQQSEPIHTETIDEINSIEHDHAAPQRKSSKVIKKKKKSVTSKKSNASSK